jgi:RimJ/RimL family protein N-acetyltransferase
VLSSTLFEGLKTRLVPLTPADAGTMARWQTDSDYLRLVDAEIAFPRSDQQIADYIHERRRSKENYLFGIRALASDELIGFVELGDILWNHRTGWLAIGIGERSYRGLGYGYDAMRLALDFAFRELNLHRVQLTVFGYNEPAIALYEKLGFQREGVYREALNRDGQRWDMYLYGILAREWLEQDNA